jgi:hypothetical protein
MICLDIFNKIFMIIILSHLKSKINNIIIVIIKFLNNLFLILSQKYNLLNLLKIILFKNLGNHYLIMNFISKKILSLIKIYYSLLVIFNVETCILSLKLVKTIIKIFPSHLPLNPKSPNKPTTSSSKTI